jgi:hypothetical protein
MFAVGPQQLLFGEHPPGFVLSSSPDDEGSDEIDVFFLIVIFRQGLPLLLINESVALPPVEKYNC